MQLLNTNNLKQIALLSLIVVLGLSILNRFSVFVPSVLAAATLYILIRHWYIVLVTKRKWKKWVAATFFILSCLILIVIPLFFLFQAIAPTLNNILDQTGNLEKTLATLSANLKSAGVPINMNTAQINDIIGKISSVAPSILGATANMLTNTVLTFFFLYFMLVQGKEMEYAIKDFLPLKHENVDDIWTSTRLMVFANAIGIPLLAVSQGIVATVGYWIFGVESFVFWGVLTGVFSIVPIVGCALVWVPICIYMVMEGDTANAIWLAVYSFVVTGGVDNVLRFTILDKIGDVHPIITTIGIIIGVPMFGFMGFIFGPLLVSYLLLLVKIYRVEFTDHKPRSDNPVRRGKTT
jgi:predicted PurR-regulated permease PerM